MAAALQLFPDQPGGERAAFGQRRAGCGQQRLLILLQSGQRVPGAGQVSHVEQRGDASEQRLPSGLRQMSRCTGCQRLQQTVQLALRLNRPVQLQQPFEQILLLAVQQEAVGQAQGEGVGRVDLAGGQAEEQAQRSGHAPEKPAAACVRVQADMDFRHRQSTRLGDDAHAGALHQAHAAAHHMAIGPADQRLFIGVHKVVQTVFGSEELPRLVMDLAWLLPLQFDQPAYVATGAEALVAAAAQQYASDLRVRLPAAQAGVERLDHRQRQCVEVLWRIKGRNADAVAVHAGQFFENHVHLATL